MRQILNCKDAFCSLFNRSPCWQMSRATCWSCSFLEPFIAFLCLLFCSSIFVFSWPSSHFVLFKSLNRVSMSTHLLFSLDLISSWSMRKLPSYILTEFVSYKLIHSQLWSCSNMLAPKIRIKLMMTMQHTWFRCKYSLCAKSFFKDACRSKSLTYSWNEPSKLCDCGLLSVAVCS